MSELFEIWDKLKLLPKGEKVGHRMAQVLDFALDPENEGYSHSAMQVLHTIVLWDEKLLGKSGEAILDLFEQAMRKSSNEEWDNFKREITLRPLEPSQAERLLIDSSGLVRNTGFEQWVLGETESPIAPEGVITKTSMLGNRETN